MRTGESTPLYLGWLQPLQRALAEAAVLLEPGAGCYQAIQEQDVC